ncbi:MAG TPA: DUF350 domain-containing protein [Thermoanaerobaculia bacterium]|nr:DUF350 domain-containing protein [Thermoanaerobaculia bacterium]
MQSSEIDLSSLLAGLLAYGVAVLVSVLLVFVTYRVNTLLTNRLEEERMLLAGHRSIAIALGATILSQALLLRHALFPIMAVVRDLFLGRSSVGEALLVAGQCALFVLVIGLLSFGSVAFAGWLFTRMTGHLPEHEEILKDNVAVAIFYAFVLLAITAILNEGIEDLARSLIPYGRTGVIRLP